MCSYVTRASKTRQIGGEAVWKRGPWNRHWSRRAWNHLIHRRWLGAVRLP